MRRTSQQGWVAWSLSALLFIASAGLGWLYMSASDQQAATDTELQQQQRLTSRLEQQLEQSRNDLTEARNERQTLLRERNALQSELDQLREQQATLEQLRQQRDELTTRNTQQQNELAELQSQVTELTQQQTLTEEALSQKDDQIAILNEQLQTSQVSVEQLREDLSEAERLIAQQRGELSEAATTEERFLAARQQLALEQAENETYSETIERLRQEMAAESQAMAQLEERLQQQLSQLNQENEQLVTKLEDGTTAIKLPESILFASGRADINDDGKRSLSNLAEALSSFPNHLISVQGHTDSQTIAPTTAKQYPTNWELSTARAASAVRELLKAGIPSNQVQAVGYADTRPLVEETSAAARQQNRRIEVILLPNQFTTRILDD